MTDRKSLLLEFLHFGLYLCIQLRQWEYNPWLRCSNSNEIQVKPIGFYFKNTKIKVKRTSEVVYLQATGPFPVDRKAKWIPGDFHPLWTSLRTKNILYLSVFMGCNRIWAQQHYFTVLRTTYVYNFCCIHLILPLHSRRKKLKKAISLSPTGILILLTPR